VEIVNPSAEEAELMDSSWKHYRATDLAVSENFENEHPDVVVRSKAEQLHVFEDFMGVSQTEK
jgi:hypothetical protein